MLKSKFTCLLETNKIKLIAHPKKQLKIIASDISDKYKELFPQSSSDDILYVSMVSYTIGSVNKNGCLILPEEGLSTYKSLIEKPLNLEHEKEDIVGFCLNAYLTNIKNNKILTESEAQEILDGGGKVNVGAVYGLWKINKPEITEMVEENFDENSEFFNKIKCSFEYYFNDYNFFISSGKADFPNGDVYPSDGPNSDEMWHSLKTNGGSGMWNGNMISICPSNGFVGGTALTLNPANPRSDLTALKEDDTVILQNVEAETIEIVQSITQLDNKEEEKSVILTTGENMSTPTTNIEVAATEVKVVQAAVPELTVDADLAKVLKSQLDEKLSELQAKDNKIAEIEAALKTELESAKAEAAQASELAMKIQEKLDAEIEARKILEAKETERARKEIVSSRLDALRPIMDVDANIAVLEKECAELSEDDFNKKVEFYKSISRKVTASETKAEVDIKQTVQEAVTNTANEVKSVNVIAPTPSDSLQTRFATAFNIETLGFKDKRLK